MQGSSWGQEYQETGTDDPPGQLDQDLGGRVGEEEKEEEEEEKDFFGKRLKKDHLNSQSNFELKTPRYFYVHNVQY